MRTTQDYLILFSITHCVLRITYWSKSKSKIRSRSIYRYLLLLLLLLKCLAQVPLLKKLAATRSMALQPCERFGWRQVIVMPYGQPREAQFWASRRAVEDGFSRAAEDSTVVAADRAAAFYERVAAEAEAEAAAADAAAATSAAEVASAAETEAEAASAAASSSAASSSAVSSLGIARNR